MSNTFVLTTTSFLLKGKYEKLQEEIPTMLIVQLLAKLLCSFVLDFLLSHFSWVTLQLGSQNFQLALSHYNNNNDPIVRSCNYLSNITRS